MERVGPVRCDVRNNFVSLCIMDCSGAVIWIVAAKAIELDVQWRLSSTSSCFSSFFLHAPVSDLFSSQQILWITWWNWCDPDRESREFCGNLWNTAHWQGMKEQRITHCRSWASCGFNRKATLQGDFFSTSTTLKLELFNFVLFHRTKFEFSFFSQSQCFRLLLFTVN